MISHCLCLMYSDDLLLFVAPRRGNVTHVERVVVEIVLACLCSVLHKVLVELGSFLVASYAYSVVCSPLDVSSLEAMIAFTLLGLQTVIKVLVCVCVLSVCSSCGVIGCVTGYLSSTVHLLLPTPLLVRYCDILVLCCPHPCTSSECL